MVTLDWDLDRADGVTLVSLFVEAPHTCRVRIENRLDGPVWPPRRRGQPADGWNDENYVGVVPADGQLTVGYSTSAAPAEPPAEVVSTEAVDVSATDDATAIDATPLARGARVRAGTSSARSGGSRSNGVAPDVEPSAAGVLRTLGDPIVPRDCVPIPAESGESATGEASNGAAGPRVGRPRSGRSRCQPTSGSETTERRSGVDTRASDADSRASRHRGGRAAASRRPAGEALVVPGSVRAWLGDVERRLDAFEGNRVERESSTSEARDGDHPNGSTNDRAPGEGDLATAVATDRRALSWLSERVDALTARAGTVDWPDDGER